jgi:hypothetical protein
MNKKNRALAAVVSVLLSACALPTREHLEALEREKPGLDAIAHACATDPRTAPDALAARLGLHMSQVLKAISHYAFRDNSRGDLCASDDTERLDVIAMAKARKPPSSKAQAEAAAPWLLRELGGASGVIDQLAIARAIKQREAMVPDPLAKRAGLPASPAGWTNLTGYTQSPGRINHVLFLDNTGLSFLAGADGGGIWKTTDGGSTWNAVNDFLGSLSIGNFAKAANDANTLYAGTNPAGSHTYFPFGVIKSTNGGLSWTQLGATNPATHPDFAHVTRIAVDPNNSQRVLAATYDGFTSNNGGAYLSTDGGTTWTKVGGISTPSYYVAWHASDSNRMAISYNDGTVRYTTTGDIQGASSTSTILAGGRYAKLAYAKSDATRMYALISDGSCLTHVYTSANSGGTWTEITTARTALMGTAPGNGTFYDSCYLSYTGALWVDPTNPARVGLAEGWASFTPDIFAVTPTWTRLSSGWTDFHGIVEASNYDGAANKTVMWMDDGGLYKTTNVDTLSITRIENGLTVSQVYSASGRTGGNAIFGAQDIGPKVFKTATGDPVNRWRLVGKPSACPGCSWIGDGMTTAGSTANSQVLYGSHQYLNMFRSSDGGDTGASIVAGSALNEGGGAGNTNAAFVAPFVLDPSNQSRMLAGGQSLWRSNDVDTGNPPTWTKIRDPYTDPNCGPSIRPIATIAVAPSNPDVIWVAHDCAGHLFKTTNGTQAVPTWTEVTTMPAATLFSSKTSIRIDPANSNVVWIGLGQYASNTLFKTTDGGATAGNWSAVAGLPGAPVYSLVSHPANSSWLYAGTGVGLFASADGGATWSASNEGPANVVVRSLSWMAGGTSPDLLVGTFGRGVWKATVASVALAASTTALSASATTAVAGTAITFTATVSGGSGTATGNVVFRDGAVDLATVALNGSAQAAFTTSALAGGSHSITANYQGSGVYDVSASAPQVITITVPNPPRLLNISTRGQVLLNNDVMIAGFIIGGATSKTVVVNVAGPSLVPYGITNALLNPALSLVRSSDQVVLKANDNWQAQTTPADVAAITASGYQPNHTAEPAIIATLPPGAYTAIVSGVGSTTGVGLVGVFEVDHPEIPLANISTRGQVLLNNDVMIAGFIIQGTGSQKVVINVAGPSLVPFGITNALLNPTLTLVRSSDNFVLGTNDNWQTQTNPGDVALIQATGLQPNNTAEPAIIATLPPGAYTAIVSGVGGTTGVGLVGVFTAP